MLSYCCYYLQPLKGNANQYILLIRCPHSQRTFSYWSIQKPKFRLLPRSPPDSTRLWCVQYSFSIDFTTQYLFECYITPWNILQRSPVTNIAVQWIRIGPHLVISRDYSTLQHKPQESRYYHQIFRFEIFRNVSSLRKRSETEKDPNTFLMSSLVFTVFRNPPIGRKSEQRLTLRLLSTEGILWDEDHPTMHIDMPRTERFRWHFAFFVKPEFCHVRQMTWSKSQLRKQIDDYVQGKRIACIPSATCLWKDWSQEMSIVDKQKCHFECHQITKQQTIPCAWIEYLCSTKSPSSFKPDVYSTWSKNETWKCYSEETDILTIDSAVGLAAYAIICLNIGGQESQNHAKYNQLAVSLIHLSVLRPSVFVLAPSERQFLKARNGNSNTKFTYEWGVDNQNRLNSPRQTWEYRKQNWERDYSPSFG